MILTVYIYMYFIHHFLNHGDGELLKRQGLTTLKIFGWFFCTFDKKYQNENTFIFSQNGWLAVVPYNRLETKPLVINMKLLISNKLYIVKYPV